jgi:hypothetical protein
MIVSLEPELLARLSRLDGAANPAAVEALDAELAAAVRRTAVMRRLFYAAVLAVALYGTATGAVARFGLPWPVAIGGIFALELGGVVFLSNAETRRRLGEPATLSRLLGAAVAGAAATFNLVTHANMLLGGFFALMSVLGFLAWWLDVENKRRDRLRARGRLAAATPCYELCGHWLRHPSVTRRARGFARAYPQLGVYGSLEAALITRRREKRNAVLADALRTRIRAAVGKDLADIAVLTYDMDEVARRLRTGADYAGLTALVGGELTAERMLYGRDDHTATAARAWLADHGDGEPHPNSGAQPDHDQQERSRLPAGGPPAAQRHASDDASEAAAQVTTGVAHPDPPPARLTGHPPDGRDTGAPVSTPARHPGGRNGSRVSLDHPDPPGSTPGRVRSPGGPTARPERAVQIGPGPGTGLDTAGSHPAAVEVRVLGTPAVLDADGSPARGLRTKGVELLVYLALHRDGAPPADIMSAIWPDVTPERAAQRLSTCLANLRNIIRQARKPTGADGTGHNARVEPVLNTGGHYRLDPDIVTVDWWQTVDAYAAEASRATGANDQAERWHQIGEALDSLAEDNDYPWIDAGRDRARQGLTQRLSEAAMSESPAGPLLTADSSRQASTPRPWPGKSVNPRPVTPPRPSHADPAITAAVAA